MLKVVRRVGFLIILIAANLGNCTDEQGRMSMFVVGCFTPEFQDIYDGDLDGYLLIGSSNTVDGSYLPRNYDQDSAGEDCGLPIRYDKQPGPFNVLAGTFFELQFEVDNTSAFGGGPLNAPGTTVVLDFPQGLVPYESSNPCDVEGGRLTCDLGLVRAFEIKGVSVRFYAAQTGTYTIEGRVFSDLVDPDPSNNDAKATFEVVSPQTQLVYPWISKNDQFSSTVIINNYGPEEALVWLSAVRETGAFHTRHLAVPARGFHKAASEALFPEIGDGEGYSIRLISESPHVRGRWVSLNTEADSGNSPAQGLAVRVPTGQTIENGRIGQEVLFSYLPVSETQISAPVLVNLGEGPAEVTMSFYNQAGLEVLSDMQTLASMAPYRPFARVANQLLDQADEDVYMIASSNAGPITGVGFVFNTSREPSIGNVTRIKTDGQGEGGSEMVLPWISNNDQFESIVVVNNYGASEAAVSLTARRREGDPETVMRQIPAGGFLRELASSLFPLHGEGAGYTVEIVSQSSRLASAWVSNNLTTASGSSPSQGIGIHLGSNQSPRFGKDLLFGYLPLTQGITSAPVVVNLGSEPADVTLRFYNETGELVKMDTDTLANLPPLRPFAAVANELVPQASGDVYLVASSNGEMITGVAFVFNGAREPAIGNASRIDWVP